MTHDDDILLRALLAYIRLHPGIDHTRLIDEYRALAWVDAEAVERELNILIKIGAVRVIEGDTKHYLPERRQTA